MPHFEEKEIPQFHPSQVWFALSRLDVKQSTVQGDFPARLIKLFAAYLAEPLTDIYNCGLRRGEYPDIYKFEICTPVPKAYPTQTTAQLRNISGLLNFDKIYEKLISKLLISDMEAKLDPAQFGNQKGVSIQHYLVQMNLIHAVPQAWDRIIHGEWSPPFFNSCLDKLFSRQEDVSQMAWMPFCSQGHTWWRTPGCYPWLAGVPGPVQPQC